MVEKKGLLFDVNLCQGCGWCYEACKAEFELPATHHDFLRDHLSSKTYTVVQEYGEDEYIRQLCMHCEEPTCASVCPVSAFKKTEEGPVIYDASVCMGCRYCMQACPFNVPRYEWESVNPKVQKCIMCSHRVVKGMETACAEACPTGATKFGNLADLKEEAQRRIDEFPDDYYPHVYGLKEVGGTGVLFLAPKSFDQFGMAMNMPEEALSTHTMAALEKVPGVVGVSTLFLGGMYWLTKRKNKIAKEEREEKSNHGK